MQVSTVTDGRLGKGLRRHELITDALQIVKTTLAATAAWLLATEVFHTELPFLAPWTALLTVHATVYRSINRGLQTTISSAIGVGLSFLIGAYLGVNAWTFALALLVGMIASRLEWIRDEGVAIATTAIFILGSGFGEQAPLLIDRLIEVALGVGVGLVVNLLLVPPLRDQQAARYVDSVNSRMGEVMIDIAEDLNTSWNTESADAWVEETVSIDREVDAAWESVMFARESRRANPRLRGSLRRRNGSPKRDSQSTDYEQILERLTEGVSHLRHLARTLRESTIAESHWGDVFRERWTDLVRATGEAIKDPDAEVDQINRGLTALITDLSEPGSLLDADWPIYGSLLTSLRHMTLLIDDVASAREARDSEQPNPS